MFVLYALYSVAVYLGMRKLSITGSLEEVHLTLGALIQVIQSQPARGP